MAAILVKPKCVKLVVIRSKCRLVNMIYLIANSSIYYPR